MPIPPIDSRSYEDLISNTEELAQALSPWRPAADGQDPGSALIRIFGRMMTHLLDRLNRVPEKHHLAFLDLLGAQRLPPRPARAPLTFHLAEGAEQEPVVPAGLQVAAAGGGEPVVFETEQELVLTRAQLAFLFVREPASASGKTPARSSDVSPVPSVEPEPFLAFSGNQPHALLASCDTLYTLPGVVERWLDLVWAVPPNETLTWSVWDGQQWNEQIVQLSSDGSRLILRALPVRSEVGGVIGGWIRAVPHTDKSAAARLHSLTAGIRVSRAGLSPDLALFNGFRLELSKDFYPLGERPRFNDTFLVASQEVFGPPGGAVTLDVTLTDALPRIGAGDSQNPTLAWELWSAGAWVRLGQSTKAGSTDAGYGFSDGTRAFTQNGRIAFTLPPGTSELPLYGATSRWLRARLISGNYGEDVKLVPGTGTAGPTLVQATFKPPSIQSLALGYTATLVRPPGSCLRQNDVSVEDCAAALQAGALAPFASGPDTRPALYLGFDQSFANRPTTLYVHVDPPLPREVVPGAATPPIAPGQAAAAPRIVWEYRTAGGDWGPLQAEDGTLAFTRSGLVRFVGPLDFALGREFGRAGFWLRARWDSGPLPFPVRLRYVLTNTVWASHTVTGVAEILGSSSGDPRQVFSTARAPVLLDARVEVREPGLPAPSELAAIEALEGADAVLVDPGATPGSPAVWVRWHAVPDFHASGPEDRHCVIDYETGRVLFGDGQSGRLPPQGRDNVRMARYRSGGGASGNVAAGTLVQLKTTVAYVDGATNRLPASGGADLEGLERLKDRASRILRHSGRAVTAQDFEDLAREASPAVARARALTPSFDPIAQIFDPSQKKPDPTQVKRWGQVGLVIVPASADPQPVPSADLIEQVRAYVGASCPPAVHFQVTGPQWAEVWVNATIVPASIEQGEEIRERVREAIRRFLHPLTGGVQGQGWDFGRWPHISDLYALIVALEGVDHVPDISLKPPDSTMDPLLLPVTLIFTRAEDINVTLASGGPGASTASTRKASPRPEGARP